MQLNIFQKPLLKKVCYIAKISKNTRKVNDSGDSCIKLYFHYERGIAYGTARLGERLKVKVVHTSTISFKQKLTKVKHITRTV